MGAEDRLASHLHASMFCSFPSLASSGFDQFSFKFRQAPNTVSISLPPGVVVSHQGAASDLKRQFLSAIALMMVSRSMVDLANRSSRVTTTTDLGSNAFSNRCNSGRSLRAPLTFSA